MGLRIYISGPMSGKPDRNFPAFRHEAARLRELGYMVVNPAEINVGTTDRAECMKADLKRLLECDAVQLLPGYAESAGAWCELMVARQIGLEVYEPQNRIERKCPGAALRA